MARLRVELRRRLDEVEASRARIATVADKERRRIERDLHDGAQQRLVSIGLALRHAQHQLGPTMGAHRRWTARSPRSPRRSTSCASWHTDCAPRFSRPDWGRPCATWRAGAPVPVEVAATGDRYPPEVETAAYFVACEGLTNTVKHAGAEHVAAPRRPSGRQLVVSVADDGVGGAASGADRD